MDISGGMIENSWEVTKEAPKNEDKMNMGNLRTWPTSSECMPMNGFFSYSGMPNPSSKDQMDFSGSKKFEIFKTFGHDQLQL